MSIVQATTAKVTPREIRRLSPAEREAALQKAAFLAEREYREDKNLTSFDAFGKEDLHGDSASTQAR